MKRFVKNKFFWISIVLILIIGFGIRWSATNATNKTKKKSTYIVKKQILKETLSISGSIEAEEKVTLRFQNSGLLAWVGVKEGDSVSKYQVLASLDQQELQKTLQKYLNTYENKRRDFDQTSEEYRQPSQGYWGLTWDQRNEVDRVLQKAQYDLNSAVLDVELKNIALRYATLISPIAGIVTRVATPIAGVNVTPTQAEIDVVNPASLYLSILPDQSEVTKITSSMSAGIIFDAYPDASVSGSISSIGFAPKTGESSTVYEVKLRFPIVPNQAYRIGMTGDAVFTITEKQDVIAIPASYLKTENGKTYVMRKINNKPTKTYVTLGSEGDDLIEITSGLAEGDVLYD